MSRFLQAVFLLPLLDPFRVGVSFVEAAQDVGSSNMELRVQRVLAPSAWNQITFDAFDVAGSSSGTWGSYQSGGSQAILEVNSFFKNFFPSNVSAVVRDDNNAPDSSFFHKAFHNVTFYDDLNINFWYYSLGMKDLQQEFIIEYFSTPQGVWNTVEAINRFNSTPVQKNITFSARAINMQSMTSIKLRFRCKGKDRSTKVYVDRIRFQGRLKGTTTANPSSSPSRAPSHSPTDSLTRDEVCPVDRLYPPSKYKIMPYTPAISTSGVEDDLSEISSLAFTNQTDAQGNLYAYVASDKNQFSLKVIRFRRHAETGQVIKGNATTVATYFLAVHYSNADWEDISLGPCSSAQQSPTCVYIGNFGNNARGGAYVPRSVLKIFKFPEPVWTSTGPSNLVNVPVTTILYNYTGFGFNSEVKYDSEAMFVDWTGSPAGGNKGDIYIVTKGTCATGRVGIIPVSYHQALSLNNVPTTSDVPSGAYIYPMAAVMLNPPKQGVDITCGLAEFRVWQGADMRRDGRLIALIAGDSPPRVYFYPRLATQSVVDALNRTTPNEGASCPYIASSSYGLFNEKRYEAVAFLPDGKGFAETSECDGGSTCEVPIYFWDLVFPYSPNATSMHGLVPASDDGQWKLITIDGFEDGNHLGNYTPGSLAYPSQAYVCPIAANNAWSMQISQHNGPNSSIAHTSNQNADTYLWLKVDFDFLLDGFDHMDALFLELSLDGGATYFIVADWAKDTQGIDALLSCYTKTAIVLNAKAFDRITFAPNVRLRFRTSANAVNDRVYIDNILFQGHS